MVQPPSIFFFSRIFRWKGEGRGSARLFQFLIAPGKTPDVAYRAIYILLLRLLSSRIRIMRVLPHPGSHNLVPWPKIRFPLAILFNANQFNHQNGLKFSLNSPAFEFEPSKLRLRKQRSLSLFPFKLFIELTSAVARNYYWNWEDCLTFPIWICSFQMIRR